MKGGEKEMNQKLTKKLIETLEGTTDPGLMVVLSRAKELASKKLKEEVKLIEGDTMQDKMKHLKHLDESMDYLTAYSMHVAKAMLMVDDIDGDNDSSEDLDKDGMSMRGMYKDHMDTLMKMADCVKAKRLAIDPLQTYVKKEDMFYSLGQLGEKVIEKIVEKEEVVKVEMEVPAMLTEQVISMTGKTELNEQLGVLMALKDNVSRLSEENMSLVKEVKALNEKIVTTKKDKVIDDALKAKKLLPAQKGWALSVPMELLEAYLAVTPVMLTDSKVKEATLDKEEPVSEGVAKFKSMFSANLKQTIGKE